MIPREFEAWQLAEAGRPLVRAARPIGALAPGEVLVEVAGCGVCHTDIGFALEGVRTGHALPLTLGHEISGRVVGAGGADGAQALLGQAVVVPAVLPCGECPLCQKGRGSICRKQRFIGSDLDGGFATHVVVPARGLCIVDRRALESSGIPLAHLGVVADAVSTPYQAILRSELGAGEVAIFVGVGGVGGFGLQIAAALGAHAVAIDVSAARLAAMSDAGAALCIDCSLFDLRAVKAKILAHAEASGWPLVEWKLFETSGQPRGQELAFGLLNHGATLSVIGYTLEKVSLRLSNLMAFDARVQGNWGCVPAHYPAALQLVLDRRVKLEPFIEARPLEQINEAFQDLKQHRTIRRPVLIPSEETARTEA
jgi:6-hydroxycyclohex-1-ene-1-carbonyl-CoA dehydrogenase